MSLFKLPGQLENETLEEAVKRLLHAGVSELPPSRLLSKEAVDALYAAGYNFYNSGHYEKAMHFFRLLTMLDVEDRKTWVGLAASYQMLKQYERALQCYGQAALLDQNDPYAHWHAAECFFALHNFEAAKEALASATITASKKPQQYFSLLERLKLMEANAKIRKKSKKKR